MAKKSFWNNPRIKDGRERILIFSELLIIAFCLYNLAFTGRIFPNTFVAGIKLGGKTKTEATTFLSRSLRIPDKIILVGGGQSFEITPASIGLEPNVSASVDNAFDVYRTGNIFLDLWERVVLIFKKTNLGLRFSKDEEKLNQQVSVIAGQIETEPIFPSLTYTHNQVKVETGRAGYRLDRELLKIKVGAAFAFGQDTTLAIPIVKIDPSLAATEATRARERGETLLTKSLEFKYENSLFLYKGPDLLRFIDPAGLYLNEKISQAVENITTSLNHDPENSVFIFKDGRVQEFKPSRDGVRVKQDLLAQMFTGNLRALEETNQKAVSVTVPVETTPATIKTSDVNNLGIKELIGRGVSHFAGSIPGRIHNLTLASSKFRGVLVAPKATLSFNDTVGDISAETGFKPAYIIKEGKTVLGDGGGVCQVSTTLFRAALNAGLPILARTAHAYRVGYYEQNSDPGLDATVYGPTVDLKFKNDTGKHILIQTSVDNQKLMLTFEIYGTKDGRMAKITKPVLSKQVPPPADIYQDDPTIPAGKVVQTEHRAWGGTVTFNYRVERDGKIIFEKTFISNYQPWGNVYLRGMAQ